MADQLAPAYQGPLAQDTLKAYADLHGDGYDSRLSHYATFEEYYDGEQRTMVSDRAATYLQVCGFQFAENVCDVVIDSMAERMEVTGFVPNFEADESAEDDAQEQPDDTTDPTTIVAAAPHTRPLTDYLAWAWDVNRMDDRQGTVHTNVLKLGDYFAMVDFDDELQQPKIVLNRPHCIRPIYSDENPDELTVVVKRWDTKDIAPSNPSGTRIHRLNLYFPNRVEKYFRPATSENGDWYQHVDEGDAMWPIPWTMDGTPVGEPIGIPVIHFRNKPKGKTYGVSEIRKVLPQQDLLNKTVLDLNEVCDYQGWPQRWIAGITEGEQQAIRNHPGEIFMASESDAKFGAFPMADLDKFVGVVEHTMQRIAGLSRTPMRFLILTGGAPSGESIRAGDAGLVGKVRDRFKSIGNNWEDVMTLVARIAKSRGAAAVAGVDFPVDMRIAVAWRDPELRNDEADWKTAQEQQAAGVSVETTLTERGYDAGAEAAKREAEAAARIDQARGAFDGGIDAETGAASTDLGYGGAAA